MAKISKRLLAVADNLIKGKPTADIGADHALLSIYLVEHNIVPRVIIGELAGGPFQKASAAVQGCSCREKIEVRQGDGLQVFKPGEVANVVIAGMGGEKIVKILSYDWKKSESYCRYIFQPMSRPEVLRQELSTRGWPILDEQLIRENERFFIIISSCPGNFPYKLSELEMEIGPVLLKKESRWKKAYLKSYIKKYKTICNSLKQSRCAQKEKLLIDYKKRIKELEGIICGGKS